MQLTMISVPVGFPVLCVTLSLALLCRIIGFQVKSDTASGFIIVTNVGFAESSRYGRLGEIFVMGADMPILRCLTFLIATLCVAPSIATAWPQSQQKLGDTSYQRILSQFGGEISDRNLKTYVRNVGMNIVRHTEFAHERWAFTVLDTPVVNAFATPGGYIYITRGLLALANDEAELAGVLGHEIAHVTLNHVSGRQKRSEKANIGVLVGTVLGGILDGKDGLKKGIEVSSKLARGYVAQYSQKQEFESDNVGQRYMIAAGYDPLAQAEFLQSMATKHALEAKIAGKSYNPNRVDIFASHPATGDRVTRARKMAAGIELREFLREGEDEYMRAIDGLIYGDSPSQGFVRGRTFAHPELRFAFSVPDSFTITNSAKSVQSSGPKGASFKLESGGKASGSLKAFITQKWVPSLAKNAQIGKLTGLKEYTSGGMRAATAFLPVKRKGADWVAQLTVVQNGDRFMRLTGFAPASERRIIRDLADAALTMRRLSERDIARLSPYRLRTHRVRRGDNIARLTRNMPFPDRQTERFLTINGLNSANDLRAGDLVKMIED